MGTSVAGREEPLRDLVGFAAFLLSLLLAIILVCGFGVLSAIAGTPGT